MSKYIVVSWGTTVDSEFSKLYDAVLYVESRKQEKVEAKVYEEVDYDITITRPAQPKVNLRQHTSVTNTEM